MKYENAFSCRPTTLASVLQPSKVTTDHSILAHPVCTYFKPTELPSWIHLEALFEGELFLNL